MEVFFLFCLSFSVSRTINAGIIRSFCAIQQIGVITGSIVHIHIHTNNSKPPLKAFSSLLMNLGIRENFQKALFSLCSFLIWASRNWLKIMKIIYVFSRPTFLTLKLTKKHKCWIFINTRSEWLISISFVPLSDKAEEL